jgi:hypothetical protein
MTRALLVCCVLASPILIAQVVPAQNHSRDDKATAHAAQQNVKMEMRYASVTSAASTGVMFAPQVSLFQCTVTTPIPTSAEPPVFEGGYVMGSAPGDNGRWIYPGEVALGQSGGNYVFVFSYTSSFGSSQLSGVAKFHTGNVHYVGSFNGVPQ